MRNRSFVIVLQLMMLASCAGYLMPDPPIEYVGVDLVSDQTSREMQDYAAVWSVRNRSARTIVWIEVSFALFDGHGNQIPRFGMSYFTTQVSCRVRSGGLLSVTTSLEPYVESLPANAAIGLFFVRSVRFVDGSVWWNFGSYRFEGALL